MSLIKGDMQSVGLFGWFISMDYPAESDVKKDVVFADGAMTGTYDPVVRHDVILEDVGIQLR